ncbi:MAG: hypothetical protein AAFX85_15005, partial [Pseudomonadota bacterium]
ARPSWARSRGAACLTAWLLSPVASAAGEWDLGADIAAELRSFVEGPAFDDQLEHLQPSTAITADLRWDSDDRRHQLVITPFARLDGADSRRTHVDLREGYYRYAGDGIELIVGAAKVFWGVTESRHLVDIVNQTDAVEDIDEEDKLGQPMVKLSLLRDWGQLDFFALPVFRERTFPGVDGRLRFDPEIDVDEARFGSDLDEQADHTDFAVRYSHYFGNVDLGLSFFNGTSREPLFAFGANPQTGAPTITPIYSDIRQIGVDAQYTANAWLWKFEGIVREGQGDTFAATVAGFEYTRYGVTQAGADLGLLVEHQYDGRDFPEAPVTVLNNDLFYGARLALNDVQDTSLLAGAITDLEDGTTSVSIEAERRFGQVWTGELEARLFVAVDAQNLVDAFARDSFVTLRLTRYF